MQLLMLGASAFFAYKIYEHIQTLQEPVDANNEKTSAPVPERTAEAFSTFDSTSLIEKADEVRESGDLQMAMAIYSEANIKEPNNAETLFKMGYTLSLENRDEEALEYFMDCIEIDNQNPFAYIEMEKIYKRMGDEEKAQNMRAFAIAIDASFKEE
jgi:tetratricopeptide (TPR) repeat protein